MNILTITTLYPNDADPKLGIFVETRLRHLLEHHPDVKAHVIAPVPWFPNWSFLQGERFAEYRKFAAAPKQEVRCGITVDHPRYLVLPKIGMLFTPFTLGFSVWRAVRKLKQSGQAIDLVDGHYFYPDGVAIALAMRCLNLPQKPPFVVTARGTDLNLIPQHSIPKRLIQWTMRKCSKVITVCEALRQEALKLGVEESKAITLRNGVDLERFQPPQDRDALRAELGISGKAILSVGWLIERKGHNLVIEALKDLPDVTLYIAGDGPELASLKELAYSLVLTKRVVFLGSLDQTQLCRWYGAVDALVLASSREGWANVLLESMACSTPVVATKVWGTPEVVQTEDVGILVDRTAASISAGISTLLDQQTERAAVRAYAEQFDWRATSDGQYELFQTIIEDKKTAPMKILYHHRIASKDGQYVHVEEIIKQLEKQGQDIILVCPKIAENADFGSSGGFVADLKKHIPGWLYELMELSYNGVILTKMCWAILKHKPDVIYERYNLLTVGGIWAAKLFNIPLMLEVNAPLFEERSKFSGLKLKGIAEWSEGYCWRNADRVLPVTDVLAQHVDKRGVDPDKITVIPNGVDLERFNPEIKPAPLPDAAQGKTIIGFVGFCREWHELDKVVELIAPEQYQHLYFLVIGDGPAREQIEQRAQELDVLDRVHFTGLVSRDAMPQWQAAIDIALQPAVVPYASPLKMLEYMACAKAIVAPDQDNIKELLEHNSNALLFSEGDTQAFLNTISQYANDAKLCEKLGQAAYQSIIDRQLTWANNAEQIIQLFSVYTGKQQNAERQVN